MILPDEIVTYPDMTKSEEEIKKQLDENRKAKLRHAARKEREAMEKVTWFDHFLDGIDRVKRLFNAKDKANQIKKQNDKQR